MIPSAAGSFWRKLWKNSFSEECLAKKSPQLGTRRIVATSQGNAAERARFSLGTRRINSKSLAMEIRTFKSQHSGTGNRSDFRPGVDIRNRNCKNRAISVHSGTVGTKAFSSTRGLFFHGKGPSRAPHIPHRHPPPLFRETPYWDFQVKPLVGRGKGGGRVEFGERARPLYPKKRPLFR